MKKKSKLINKCNLLLFILLLALCFKINEIKQFVTLPMISSWFPFERWFDFNDSTVSSTQEYYHLIDHFYTNASNICNSIDDGIVLEVNERTVHVLNDNGVLIIYGELENILSKVDDRILKGQIIGEFSESLTLHISKDNHELSYEEVMKF